MIKIAAAIMLVIFFIPITGCLYRGEGIFKQIGDTDYKTELRFMYLFVAADGNPTYVDGSVMLEDHITPVKFADVILRKKDQ